MYRKYVKDKQLENALGPRHEFQRKQVTFESVNPGQGQQGNTTKFILSELFDTVGSK